MERLRRWNKCRLGATRGLMVIPRSVRVDGGDSDFMLCLNLRTRCAYTCYFKCRKCVHTDNDANKHTVYIEVCSRKYPTSDTASVFSKYKGSHFKTSYYGDNKQNMQGPRHHSLVSIQLVIRANIHSDRATDLWSSLILGGNYISVDEFAESIYQAPKSYKLCLFGSRRYSWSPFRRQSLLRGANPLISAMYWNWNEA